MTMILCIFIGIIILIPTYGAPKNSFIHFRNGAQNDLIKFDYLLQSGDLKTENAHKTDRSRDAIGKLQASNVIPETGGIDDYGAMRNLIAKRRCPLPDEPDLRSARIRHKRFSIHHRYFQHKNLTWSLRTNAPRGLDVAAVRWELGEALDLWAKNSALTFREVNSDSADILVYFYRGAHGDGYPFDGSGQILAHAFHLGSSLGGQVHFDEEEIWSLQNDGNEEGTSLFGVAAHEFGHSLGMGHSSVQGTIMFPFFTQYTPNYTLPDDDRHGIQQMYGIPGNGRLWSKIPSRIRPLTSTTVRTTTSRIAAIRPITTSTRKRWKTLGATKRRHYPWKSNRNHHTVNPHHKIERPKYPPKSHKPRTEHPTTRTTTVVLPRTRSTPNDDIPNQCDTSYDAISIIRRETFIFKGRYMWRIGDQGMYWGYPARITRMFKFPEDIDHVDDVYERLDAKIMFFVGKYYYVFDGTNLAHGYPKPLRALGLPETLEKIDGATIWGHENQIYFFSGSLYWKFDESTNQVDYPRNMSTFVGVGNNIDTVFRWRNDKTYFFKGKGFWEFDDLAMKVAHEEQRLSAPVWMGCPQKEKVETSELTRKEKHMRNSTRVSLNSGWSVQSHCVSLLLNISFLALLL